MKILLVHNYYQYRGGEDTYFDSLTNLLKRKGHNIFTYTKNSNKIKSLKDKIKMGIGMFWNKKSDKELREILLKFKPDVAHFHNIYPFNTPSAYTICKQYNISVVQRIPSYRSICPKGTLFRNDKICELCVSKQFLYPAVLNKCYHNSLIGSFIFSSSLFYHNLIHSFSNIDKFIFQTSFVMNYYIEKTKLPLSKTAIIHHFVPRHSYVNFEKDDYFLFAGRLSEEKGILPLLQIFSTLSNARLIIVGDGLLKPNVMQFSKYKNIIIKSFQTRNEVLRLMSKALCTIIPSLWYETGPFVLMESFSTATPVIAPRFGVFKEEIKNGKTGLFYKHNDMNDLKNKILYVLKQKNYIKKMNKYAYKQYQQSYTEDKHYKSLVKLYKEVMARK